MSITKTLSLAALISVLAGCTLFPKAKNVTISGTVTDKNGQPISGLEIYYVVLKFQPGMPGTAEHGVIVTDSQGRYSVRLRKVYDVVSLSENSFPLRCGAIANIPAERLVTNQNAVFDFVCQQAANNSFKPNPLRGSA